MAKNCEWCGDYFSEGFSGYIKKNGEVAEFQVCSRKCWSEAKWTFDLPSTEEVEAYELRKQERLDRWYKARYGEDQEYSEPSEGAKLLMIVLIVFVLWGWSKC